MIYVDIVNQIEKGYRVSLCRENRSIDAGRMGTELFKSGV